MNAVRRIAISPIPPLRPQLESTKGSQYGKRVLRSPKKNLRIPSRERRRTPIGRERRTESQDLGKEFLNNAINDLKQVVKRRSGVAVPISKNSYLDPPTSNIDEIIYNLKQYRLSGANKTRIESQPSRVIIPAKGRSASNQRGREGQLCQSRFLPASKERNKSVQRRQEVPGSGKIFSPFRVYNTPSVLFVEDSHFCSSKTQTQENYPITQPLSNIHSSQKDKMLEYAEVFGKESRCNRDNPVNELIAPKPPKKYIQMENSRREAKIVSYQHSQQPSGEETANSGWKSGAQLLKRSILPISEYSRIKYTTGSTDKTSVQYNNGSIKNYHTASNMSFNVPEAEFLSLGNVSRGKENLLLNNYEGESVEEIHLLSVPFYQRTRQMLEKLEHSDSSEPIPLSRKSSSIVSVNDPSSEFSSSEGQKYLEDCYKLFVILLIIEFLVYLHYIYYKRWTV